jgi:hypothetical protein
LDGFIFIAKHNGSKVQSHTWFVISTLLVGFSLLFLCTRNAYFASVARRTLVDTPNSKRVARANKCQLCGEELEQVPTFSFGSTAVIHRCKPQSQSDKRPREWVFWKCGESVNWTGPEFPAEGVHVREVLPVAPASNTDKREELATTYAVNSCVCVCPACNEETTWPRHAEDFKAGWDARDEEVNRIMETANIIDARFQVAADALKTFCYCEKLHPDTGGLCEACLALKASAQAPDDRGAE